MTMIAAPVARDIDHHSVGMVVTTVSPATAEIMCPPMTLIGWETGAFGRTNSRTQDAPKLAMSSG